MDDNDDDDGGLLAQLDAEAGLKDDEETAPIPDTIDKPLQVEARTEIPLDEAQQHAIGLACDNTKRLVAITGDAGSGKTTILRTAYQMLVAAGYRVAVSAPTGKAAKRIFEATGIRAVTNHKLLEYTQPGEVDQRTGRASRDSFPRKDQDNPLLVDVVLCDEYKMVNWEIHNNIIRALPAGGRLVTTGDMNQLSPIEDNKEMQKEKCPFNTLLDKFHAARLSKIYRQAEGSGILDNSQRVLKGLSPLRQDDFPIAVTDDPIARIRKLLLLDDLRKILCSQDGQIIIPQKVGKVGTQAINSFIQNIVEDENQEAVELPRYAWDTKHPVRIRIGSKIICVKNDYNLNIFNGETGIVEQITELGEIIVNLGDRVVNIPPDVEYNEIDPYSGSVKKKSYDPRRDLQLAYAITTHKAQGSQYKRIVYVMNRSMYGMQSKENLYTGMTRGIEWCELITDTVSLHRAMRKTETMLRTEREKWSKR